ncbi:MAG: hypothetical protein ACI4FX_10935 [Agathobacter sp.]
MKCIDCMYIEEVGDSGLYICTNKNSQNYGEYTGLCCEDECDDGEEF